MQDLIKQLASDDAHIYAAAVRQLLHGGAKAAVALSRVCDSPSVLSRRAADALIKIGRDAVEPLVQVLKTGDQEAQVHAINGLLLLNEPSSLQALIEALESPFAVVRRATASALWMLRDSNAVEPLIRHLLDDDIDVAAGVASTLGWIGDRRAVAPLLLALENRNWRLRRAAAFALGDIGDEHALEAVRGHLFDPKPQVRKAVKGALLRFDIRKRHPSE
jgi:HEAT repeat protein